MSEIVGVKFKNSCKIYYFGPKGLKFEPAEGVIVETARGLEYGIIALRNRDVDDKQIVQPLKDIIRKATEDDLAQLEKNKEMGQAALDAAHSKIEKHNLAMKLVDAEYTFDRGKLIFYFTAAGRVDFRELVKDLASTFRTRIELRQIYERDDVKLRGAVGCCGRECCCKSFLPDFEKVSIKMAKIQGLSLNPTKISGACGRLMCCLKYENDYYNETYRLMPKIGSRAKTPDGEGTVESNDIVRRQVKVKVLLSDGSFDSKIYKLDEITAQEKQSSREVDDSADESVKKLED